MPTLATKRLILNDFAQDDAQAVKTLITENVAVTTLNIPYP